MGDDPDDAKSAEKEAAIQARRNARAELPATYIDTWSTLIWKDHIRITLGEWIVDDPSYRVAYVMELDDAKRFAEHLLKRVQRQHERDSARAKSELGGPEGES